MFKKCIIVSIICLLILMIVPKGMATNDIEFPKEKITKNESLDGYIEYFTIIYGNCKEFKEEGKMLFIHRNIEMWAYYFNGTRGTWSLNIRGIGQPSFPSDIGTFDHEVRYIKVPLLIGVIRTGTSTEIKCFTFGNIEWKL